MNAFIETDGLAQQEELDDGHCAFCHQPIEEVTEADADGEGRVFVYHSFVCTGPQHHSFHAEYAGCGDYHPLWEGADYE